MHACAPLPTRSREPSRTQSHRPQYRPHARVAHMRAIHTHATPMRAPSTFTSCLQLYHSAFSLCHSPDLSEPPHATKTLYINIDPAHTAHPHHERPPPAHIATLPPPLGGGGGGTPPSPPCTEGEGPPTSRTPSSRPGAVHLLAGGGGLHVSVRSIAPDPQGWGRSARRPAPPTPMSVVRTGSNPKACKP